MKPNQTYLPIKRSHVYFLKDTELYEKTKDGLFSLYKKREGFLDFDRLEQSNLPDLYIRAEDKKASIRRLVNGLNKTLSEKCLSDDLVDARNTLTLIINEATQQQQGAIDLEVFPETVDILFDSYAKRSELFETMAMIRTNAPVVTEHTINVMLLTFRYGFFKNFEGKKIKQLAMSAMFHDIGCYAVDISVYEKKERLTDSEYEAYRGHTVKGSDLIRMNAKLDPLVAKIALEHHERADGSGYPFGVRNLSMESQLIGLIDCYEFLTYREKAYRKAKKPFDSLDLIKEEVLEGRFQKALFKDFCSCLSQ